MKVHAVIVTHNRLPMLRESVAAVLAQRRAVDKLLIVDNNSNDGTSEYLAELKADTERGPKSVVQIEILLLKRNVGGAGGFYHGVKKSYEDGADWIWLMDDDSICLPDTLGELLDSPAREGIDACPQKTGFLASRVDFSDGNLNRMNIPGVHPEWNAHLDEYPGCVRIVTASFVSLLVSREAVKYCGFPVKEFFIWFDDWEYTHRISSHFAGFYVPQSVVVHKTPENKIPDFVDVDKDNVWKYGYGLRNQMAFLNQGLSGPIRAALLYFGVLRRISFKSKRVWLRMLWAGLRGFFFRYRKRIEYPFDSPRFH